MYSLAQQFSDFLGKSTVFFLESNYLGFKLFFFMETGHLVVILVSQHVKLPHSFRAIALNMDYAACHYFSMPSIFAFV